MTDLVPHSPSAPALRTPSPVHEAVRDQLIEDLIGDQKHFEPPKLNRIEALLAAVDATTFNAILHWLSGAKRSALPTKRRYAEDIAKFAEWACEHYGVRPVPLLSVLDYDGVTTWTVYARSQGLAVRSQRRILAGVSSLFGKIAVPRGWAQKNPVSFEDHAPAVGKSDDGRPAGATRVLSLEYAVKMRKAAQTAEEKLVYDLLFEMGLRESECAALLVENLDRRESPIVLNFRRKRGKWAKRQVPPHIMAHFDAVLDGRAEGPVLINPKTGAARTRHQIIDISRRLARRGGVPDPQTALPHALRATAITALLEAGKPLHEVQKWADHDHASTTQGYWLRANSLQKDSALSASLAAIADDMAADMDEKANEKETGS